VTTPPPAPRSLDRHPSTAVVAAGAIAAAGVASAIAIDRAARDAERRHPPIGRFMEVDGVRLHYAEWGEGEPVVLINGNGTLVQDWALSGVVGLAAQQYRVIAIDRPGYGYSARPRDRVWTARAQAALFAKAFGHLGLDRPLVVGHSWGALVAAALGLDHPDAARGLVLLSGYYYPTARLDVWLFAGPAIPVVGDVMRHTISPPLTRLLAPRIMRKVFEPRPVPARFAQRFPLDLALRPISIKASAEDSALMVPSAAALQDRYRDLDLPAAILVGAQDRIITPERQSGRLAGELPERDIEVLQGLGHMIHYDAQHEIVAAIGRVMARAETFAAAHRSAGREERRLHTL
jgi:pimeloyl-ACP methyl ester carboxylesterase